MPGETLGQPDPQPQPESQPLETSVMPSSVPSGPNGPGNAPTTAPKKGGRKLGLLIVVIIIVIAAGAAAYFVKAHKSTATAKKDIPLLNYGFSDTSDLTPTYPLDTPNSNNIVFIDSQLFEGLVRYQDQIKIAPALATSWSNPNNTTWIFNIRHGVTFNDGRTMTAADVKYSLDYAVANQDEDNNSTILALASSIDQVTVVSPYQVKITTDGPDAVLLNQLAFLYIVDSKAKLGASNAGTGPYTVKAGSAKSNATSLNLVASNNYWGGHVYTREVHFQEVSSLDQLAADTAKGQFDIAGDFNAQQLATVKAKASHYQTAVVPDLGVAYIELNLEKTGSPLQSLAARQAATYALNIPAILKAGNLNGSQVNQVIPPTLPGYDPSIKNTAYDPAKAKQLLTTVPNASAPLALYYGTGDEGQVGEIAKELNAVGFNVKATAVSDFDAFLSQLASGQGDMFYLTYDTNTLDGLDMINNTVAGTQNYNSPELTSLISQAGATIDPTTRIGILQKIEQLVATDIPTIALFTQVRTYTVTKPYIVNTNLPAVDTGTYFWQVYQK